MIMMRESIRQKWLIKQSVICAYWHSLSFFFVALSIPMAHSGRSNPSKHRAKDTEFFSKHKISLNFTYSASLRFYLLMDNCKLSLLEEKYSPFDDPGKSTKVAVYHLVCPILC